MGATDPDRHDAWTLAYDGFDPDAEGLREALCTLGNGRFATRGAAEEASADGVHYPGTYIAGGYNQLASDIAGRTVVNEDLVNLPNWLPLTFRPEDGEWLESGNVELLELRRELRMAEGVLYRRMRIRDANGRVTTVESRRIVSMRDPFLAAIEYGITPENWGGAVRVRSLIDGAVRNTGVARYRQLNNRHLQTIATGRVAPEGVYLLTRTTQSRLEIALAARTRLFRDEGGLDAERAILDATEDDDRIGEELRAHVREGETLRVEKVVALYTSRDRGITEAALDARLALDRAGDFDDLLARHRLVWQALWRRFDIEIEIESRVQLILRLHIFHLLQTLSPHTPLLDAGAPARGLHGEAYRGHVFWDEVFILPFYNLRTPSITRGLLLYRYARLDSARELARLAGYAGAMYPWQSSSDGREATQQLHLNPLSGHWGPDHSRLQRHINAVVVYNVWHYVRVSGDVQFLVDYGAEMVLEIARFWSSLARRNGRTGRFEIVGVMGPDEYHETHPDAETGGLRNNAYTNIMAVWCLERALDILDQVGGARRAELMALLDIGIEEVERWHEISRMMTVPFHNEGIISQFEGYEALPELDWEGYRRKYGNIERLDRILKAEGDSPDRYKVSKQADVDMLFHLLDPGEVKEILERLGYGFDADMIRRNVEYYVARTSHGSTLSKVVYAFVVHHFDPEEGCRLFRDALRSDIDDVQRGTTPEGIHLGAMAGTVGIVLRRYAGVRMGPDGIMLDPELPAAVRRLAFRLHWRGRWLKLEVTADRVSVTADRQEAAGPAAGAVPIRVHGARHEVAPGETLEVVYGP